MKVTDEMVETALQAFLRSPHDANRVIMRAAIEAALAVMPKPAGTVGEMMPHQTLRDKMRRIAREEIDLLVRALDIEFDVSGDGSSEDTGIVGTLERLRAKLDEARK